MSARLRRALYILCLLPLPAVAQITVLTSIKPLQLIAAAVQGEQGQPQVLLPANASPHQYALRPSDLRALHSAQLFYWVGPELERFLEKPLQQRSLPSQALASLPGLKLRHFAKPDHDEHKHEQAHDHDHAPGSLDAHLWLSPDNALVVATRIAEDLSKLDPEHAADYQTNLQQFRSALEALDQRLTRELAPLKSRPFFVLHETYDYFEAHYDLKHSGVLALQAEVAPGARHLAELRQQLQEAGKACIFNEPQQRPPLLTRLSEGLPIKLAELDALGVDVPASPQGYVTLLQHLADGFTHCLGSQP